MEEKYIVSEDFYIAYRNSAGEATELAKGSSKMIELSPTEYKNAVYALETRVRQLAECHKRDRDVGLCEPDLFARVIELSQQYTKLKFTPGVTGKELQEKAVEIGPELINTNRLMYILNDLKLQKDEYVASLKYYDDVPSLSDWSSRFDEAYKERDIDKIVSLFNELIVLNRQSIVDYVNDKSDDGFVFIGHSLRGTTEDLRGIFKDRYVSASLFNSEFHDTYNDSFGYIMSPKNIVGAAPCDSYTNNSASDTEHLTRGTYVPKMYHPQEIIKSMRKHREENENNKELNYVPRVFSEIVLDGFEPTGIFCFTNGLKEFDENYVKALELKKNCPDLELKVFDVLEFKKGKALEEEKLQMLLAIQRKLEVDTPYKELIKAIDVPLYERFFTELDELKKKGDYTAADIERIFYETKDLRTTTSYELFEKGRKYSDEDMKYILGKGSNFNIDLILSGKALLTTVNYLSNLSKYVIDERCKSIMDKFYPGLAEFTVLVKRVNLTAEMYEELKQKKLLNFADMNRYLYKVVKDKMAEEQTTFADEKDNIKIELAKKQLELEELYKRKENAEKEREKYENMRMIVDSEYQLKIIEKDMLSAETKLASCVIKKQEYQTEKHELEAKKNAKTKEKELYKKNKEEYDEKYTVLLNELVKLRKHPFINKKKIAIKQQELKELSDSGLTLYEDVSSSVNYERDIIAIDDNLDTCQSNLVEREREEKELSKIIEDAKAALMKMYGKGDIEGAKAVIEDAKYELEFYDADYLDILDITIKLTLTEIREKEIKYKNIEMLEENLKSQKSNTL